MILVDRSDVGAGDFDIYLNYNGIHWETGDFDGGSGGFGGTSASVGYSAATGAPGTYYQLAGSLENGALVNGGVDALASHTNDGVIGQYLFQVRDGQVLNNPTPDQPAPPVPQHGATFSVSGLNPQLEGNSGATPFTAIIHRSSDEPLAASSTVNWSVHIADVTDLVPNQPLSGTVTFDAGQTDATVVINVQGDTFYEPDDYFSFRLDSVSYGDDTWNPDLAATAIILNDDSPISFSGPQIRPEGNAGTSPMDFMVLRAGDASRALTVTWHIELGTADAADFAPNQPLSGTVTFAAGATQAVIEVLVAGDTKVEPDETFTVKLDTFSTGGGAPTAINQSTTGTILDDDTRLTLLVGTPTTVVQAEGDSGLTPFTFTIMRVGDITTSASVAYTINPADAGAAAAIASPLTGAVTFAAGAWSTTLTVNVHGDTVSGPNESFAIHVGGGDFNALTLNGVIMNDDKAVAAAASASASTATLASDTSAFLQHLAGGSLWSDSSLT